MGHIRVKARGGPDIPRELGGHRDRRLGDGPAAEADEVDVGGVVGEVVGRRPVVEMRMRDDPELLEGVEAAVDRRQREGGTAVLGDPGRRPRRAFRARGW